MRRENCWVKCRTRSGISAWRSRKGGTWTGKTFKRKKRSDRNFCSLTIPSKSRFVAAIKRASVRSVVELPRRSNSLSCSTRSSLLCNSRGISPISSRNIVPPLATSKRPRRWAIAPVNAPLSCPNSSLSSKPVGMAAQLSFAKPFVKLNCAAIPTGLLESELFGHERGAFTGAIAQRLGRFEVANGGTMFLDEIGEIPLELQSKLLRVLQEREFERLGSSTTLRTDARLIAATNRDLEGMVSEQKFRSDLFFRLNVFPVHVPPLRERQADIPLLVRHFTQQFSRRMKKVIETIPSAAMDALCRYHWPGNIRELQNVIERAVIISAGPALSTDACDRKSPHATHAEERAATPPSPTNGALDGILEETERRHILDALQQCNWVVAGSRGAAALLGINRSTLQVRIRKLGISRGTA